MSDSLRPMDFSPPSSLVHGILQARILEWVAILQGIFPTQGSNPGLPHCRQMLYRLSHTITPHKLESATYTELAKRVIM